MVNIGCGDLKITQHLANLESDVMLNRLLMLNTKTIVRVYVIGAFNLSSRDAGIGNESDPYIIVSMGSKEFNERDAH
jgi:hypothetical protein